MSILKQKQGKWTKLEENSYANEGELQSIIAEDANILPLEDIGYESSFITIGKEVGLDNGSLDLLAVSPEGHIAIIETKLDKNPEVKRTVVGQILGYSAYLWNQSYREFERACFDKYKQELKNVDEDINLVDYIKQRSQSSEFNEEEFISGIEKRLNQGSFSLLIVVDKANKELKDIANYLNDRTGQEIAEKLLNEFKKSESVNISWRKNGFSLQTKLPEKLKKELKSTATFSYLFFESKGGDNDKISFMGPNTDYENKLPLKNIIKEYVEYYRSIDSYIKESERITDFETLKDEKINKLIELIKNTRDELLDK